MPGATKERLDQIQATAREIIAEHGGREHLDDLPAVEFKPVAIAMSHQLVNREGVAYQTARKHIAKALRILRGEYVKAKWGGHRPNAGRKPEK